ncbi:MAG TPA: hypothetical protein PKH37_04140 [Alphaproteobacteria bacterium]|nr:hypothetical protein [Alphaproteobacteria bacterium]
MLHPFIKGLSFTLCSTFAGAAFPNPGEGMAYGFLFGAAMSTSVIPLCKAWIEQLQTQKNFESGENVAELLANYHIERIRRMPNA